MYVFGSVFDLDPPFGGRNGCGGFWIKKYGKDVRNGYNGDNGMPPGIAAAGTKEPDAGRKNFPFFLVVKVRLEEQGCGFFCWCWE